MNGRPWETELEQFLQSKLDALSVTPNQGIGRRTVRIFPPPAEDEAKYFMLGMESGLFEVGQDGRIQSRLLALPAEHSETGEIFGLFTSEPGTPRLVRERVVQLAAAAALLRSAPPGIAEAYALTRLAVPSRMIGANDLGTAVNPLLERAVVAI